MKPSVSILSCITSQKDWSICCPVSEPASIADGMNGTSNVSVKFCTQFGREFLILYWLLRWISVGFVWNSLSHTLHICLTYRWTTGFLSLTGESPHFEVSIPLTDTGSTGRLNSTFSSKIALYCDNGLGYMWKSRTQNALLSSVAAIFLLYSLLARKNNIIFEFLFPLIPISYL